VTPTQAEKIVAADTRVREAARDVVDSFGKLRWINTPRPLDLHIARLSFALAEFDRAMEEQK